jgi:hypothetical protein
VKASTMPAIASIWTRWASVRKEGERRRPSLPSSTELNASALLSKTLTRMPKIERHRGLRVLWVAPDLCAVYWMDFRSTPSSPIDTADAGSCGRHPTPSPVRVASGLEAQSQTRRPGELFRLIPLVAGKADGSNGKTAGPCHVDGPERRALIDGGHLPVTDGIRHVMS